MERSGYHSGGKQVQYLSQIGAHPSQPDFNLRCLGPLLLIVSVCVYVCMCVCVGWQVEGDSEGLHVQIKQESLKMVEKLRSDGEKDTWKWWKLEKKKPRSGSVLVPSELPFCLLQREYLNCNGLIWNVPNTRQLSVLHTALFLQNSTLLALFCS